MSINRRSFLELLGLCATGAVAAPDFLRIPKAVSKVPAFLPTDRSDHVTQHFTVWDTVTIQPGFAMDESLFLPPLPRGDFTVCSLGAFWPADTAYADLSAVARGADIDWWVAGIQVMHAPLWALPMDGEQPLVAPLVVLEGQDWMFRCISSDIAELSAPVSVSIVLSGLIQERREAHGM